MTKQQYQGRHRSQAAAPYDPPIAPLSSVPQRHARSEPHPPHPPHPRTRHDPRPRGLATTGSHDVAALGSSGRHRGPSTHTVPRLVGTGVLLPTAATATIVLTTTGAHLGAAPSPAAVVALPASAQSGQADAMEAKSRLTYVHVRTSPELSSRSAARGGTATANPRSAAQIAADATAAIAAKRAAALASAHRWVTPLDVGYRLTSGFGMRWGVMHPGQDFAVPVGSPIKAMSSGTVLFAGWSGGYGYKVEIRYWDGTISWYGHNSRLKVRAGEPVTPGELVALSGSTGHSTGPHSHIEIHLNGNDTPASAVPPLPWLATHGNMPGRSAAPPPSASP